MYNDGCAQRYGVNANLKSEVVVDVLQLDFDGKNWLWLEV